MSSSKDVREILKALDEQGFDARQTKNGHWFITLQGVPVTTIPGTTSDHRALKNSIAQARRAGFVWKR